MNKQKLTPWFPEDVKPVRKGVYITEIDWCYDGFSRWNGRQWSNQRGTPDAASRAELQGAIQEKRWRGLATDPMAAGRT